MSRWVRFVLASLLSLRECPSHASMVGCGSERGAAQVRRARRGFQLTRRVASTLSAPRRGKKHCWAALHSVARAKRYLNCAPSASGDRASFTLPRSFPTLPAPPASPVTDSTDPPPWLDPQPSSAGNPSCAGHAGSCHADSVRLGACDLRRQIRMLLLDWSNCAWTSHLPIFATLN